MSKSSFQVICPQCQSHASVSQDQIGEAITCDDCLEEFVVTRAHLQVRGSDDSLPRDQVESVKESDRKLEEDFYTDSRIEDVRSNGGQPDSADEVPVSDTIRIDDLLVDEFPQARPEVLECDFEFSTTCLVCGTRQTVSDDQIGNEIKCPDCFSGFTVREPPASARRSKSATGATEEDEYQLGEVVERPREFEQPAVGPVDIPVRSVEARSPVLDALQKAEEEIAESDPVPVPRTGNPLVGGLLEFWLDAAAVVRLILLAVGLSVEGSAIRGALARLSGQDPMMLFISMAMMAFSFVFGLMLFSAASATFLAVVQESSVGHQKIENWPSANFMDWVFDGLFVIGSLFVGLVPGVLVGQLFLGGPYYVWGMILMAALTVFATFPVLFLSVLETSSPVGLYSAPIWASLGYAREYWVQFFVLALPLFLPAVILPALPMDSLIPIFLTSLVAVGLLMTYFRALGRLAWICQESAPDPDSETDEPEDGNAG